MRNNSIRLRVDQALRRLATLKLGREDGQTLPEYALVVALIAVALIAAMTFLSDQISGVLNQVGSKL